MAITNRKSKLNDTWEGVKTAAKLMGYKVDDPINKKKDAKRFEIENDEKTIQLYFIYKNKKLSSLIIYDNGCESTFTNIEEGLKEIMKML